MKIPATHNRAMKETMKLSERTESALREYHNARERQMTVRLLWLFAASLVALGVAIWLPR